MHKIPVAPAAVAALFAAASPAPANAMAVGTAPGIALARADIGSRREVRHVCRYRVHTGRRLCWWEPGRRWHWGWRRWR